MIYYSQWQEALDSWTPAAPVIKKELLLPSMAGLDSWGRSRRIYGDERSLAGTVNTVRSVQGQLRNHLVDSEHFTGTFRGSRKSFITRGKKNRKKGFFSYKGGFKKII